MKAAQAYSSQPPTTKHRVALPPNSLVPAMYLDPEYEMMIAATSYKTSPVHCKWLLFNNTALKINLPRQGLE
jgi:hypothetical protein